MNKIMFHLVFKKTNILKHDCPHCSYNIKCHETYLQFHGRLGCYSDSFRKKPTYYKIRNWIIKAFKYNKFPIFNKEEIE